MYIKLYQNEQVLKTSSSPSPTVNMFLSAPESSSCAAGEMLGIPVGVTVVNGWMMRVFKRSLIARPLKRKKKTLSFDENCCSFSCREPTTWPANNCQQIMVCSCKMSSYCVWLTCLAANNILLMRKWNHAFLLLGIALGRTLRFPKIFIKKQTRWSNDKTISLSVYNNTNQQYSPPSECIMCELGFRFPFF